jgi:hypothetical protein
VLLEVSDIPNAVIIKSGLPNWILIVQRAADGAGTSAFNEL